MLGLSHCVQGLLMAVFRVHSLWDLEDPFWHNRSSGGWVVPRKKAINPILSLGPLISYL